jgi:hypothetical protein
MMAPRWAVALVAATAIVTACTTKEIVHQDDDDDGTSVSSGGADPVGTGTGANTGAGAGMGTTTSTGTGTSTTTTTTTTTTTGTGCAQLSTFGECADCYCNQHVNACNAYLTAVIDNIYCGVTCGNGACATFCADPVNTAISTACDNCTNNPSQGDLDAFISQCQNDANCLNFAQILQACPD